MQRKKIKPAGTRKTGYQGDYPLMIQAVMPVKAPDGVVGDDICFDKTAISYVRKISDNFSVIRLKTGENLPVSLSYNTLHKVIYKNDEAREELDLRNYAVLVPDSAPAAEVPKQKSGLDKEILIRAFLRKPQTNHVFVHEFSFEDVNTYQGIDTKRSTSGEALRLHFNHAAKNPPVCGLEAILDMPMKHFQAFLNKAWQEKQDKLDLCDLFARHPDKYGLDF